MISRLCFVLAFGAVIGCFASRGSGSGDLGADDGAPELALPDELSERFVPGTRLRAVEWVPEDGDSLRQVFRWLFAGDRVGEPLYFDLAFDRVPCGLSSRSESGTPRCLPTVALLQAFEDPACEVPLSSIAFPVGLLESPRREAGALRFFRIRDAAPTPADTRYVERLGTCEGPSDSRWPPGTPVHRYDPLDESELVARVAEDRTALGGGVEEVRRRYEDGSTDVVRTFASSCIVWPTADGLRCWPGLRVENDGFSDAACQDPSLPAGEDAEDVVVLDAAGLSRSFRVTGDGMRNVFRRDDEGVCRSNPPERVLLLEERTPDEAPALRLAPTGSGRLQPMRFFDAAGRAIAAPRGEFHRTVDRTGFNPNGELLFFDTALGIECIPIGNASDVRCFPRDTALLVNFEASALEVSFADAACTEPAVLVSAPRGAADPTHLAAYGVRADRTNTPLTLRRLRPAPEGTTGFVERDGECSPDDGRSRRRVFLIGDAVPIEDYAAFRPDGR